MRTSLTVLAAALCLSLAACAQQPAPPRHSDMPSSPAPTVTSTPVVQTKPALGELVISEDGLGPIAIGAAYAPAPADAAVLIWDDTFCDFEGDSVARDFGNWKPNYPLENGYEVFYAGVASMSDPESPIARIETRSTQIRTAEGLGIGSSTSEVTAAYGSRVTSSPVGYAYPYTVSGGKGQIVFWFADGVDGVVLLQVLAGFDAPVWSNDTTACA